MLKKQVEKIFGENSYKAINFYDCPSTYYYVANEDIYINQGQPMGGNFSTASFKLSKAYKSGDDLVMEVLYDTDAHSDEEIDKYDFIYIYTFELKNDSYIFKSLDKKFVS